MPGDPGGTIESVIQFPLARLLAISPCDLSGPGLGKHSDKSARLRFREPSSAVAIHIGFMSCGRSCARAVIRNGGNMISRSLMVTAALAVAALGAVTVAPTTARAQNNVEAEIIGFHQLCEKGDRRACVRFGILIGQNEQRHADWHRTHADWWWGEDG